jgi:putative copper export protein
MPVVVRVPSLVAPRTRMAVLLAAPWLFLRSFQGHAGAHGIVPALIDWHLVAAAIWIGGLVQLSLVPRPVPPPVAHRMRTVATAALAVVLPAGVYGAVLHVQRWNMPLGSPYERALLVKLTIASTLVALGAVNHFRHVPALVQGDAEAAGHLTTTVRFEVLMAAAVSPRDGDPGRARDAARGPRMSVL